MGSGRILFILLSSILVYMFSNQIQAQDTLQSSNEFIIGSFIASTSDPDYTFYNNYYQVVDLGLILFFSVLSRTYPN